MHFNEILTNPLHELGSPWQRAAQLPHCSVAVRTRCGVGSVLGQAGHGPSQWERARAPCSLHGAVAGAALSDSHPPGVHGRQAVQPRRGLHAQGAKLLHGVPPPAPAQLRPGARLPTCPAGSPFGHCHAQTVPRPAASDLLCSKGACRPLAAPARAAVCPELSPCCPTCRIPCCPGPRRKQDTRPSAASAELSLSLTALRLTED